MVNRLGPLPDDPNWGAFPFRAGDSVRLVRGAFESFEGTILRIDRESGKATVVIKIFGRTTADEVDRQDWG